MATMPMFPLGSVLLPGSPLPLQVFEPRYRTMLDDCLAGDQSFGVVLIERGFEVGGDDQRSAVGTVAQIVQVARTDEGVSVLLAVGTDRLRVTEWLDDDPYPRADVELWPDAETDDAELRERYVACTAEMRHLLGLSTELGQDAPPATFDAPDDPAQGVWLLAALVPVGSFDRQRLLIAPDALQRLALLIELISDQRLMLENGLELE